METRTNIDPDDLESILGARASTMYVREHDGEDLAAMLDENDVPYYAELEDRVWSFYIPRESAQKVMLMCADESIDPPDESEMEHDPDFATGDDETLLAGISATNPGPYRDLFPPLRFV